MQGSGTKKDDVLQGVQGYRVRGNFHISVCLAILLFGALLGLFEVL